jgi:hypothetical protein
MHWRTKLRRAAVSAICPSARVRDLLVRAKDLLERAKLLLWGANRIGDRGRVAPARQILNLVEHAPEQHPLRLAVAA